MGGFMTSRTRYQATIETQRQLNNYFNSVLASYPTIELECQTRKEFDGYDYDSYGDDFGHNSFEHNSFSHHHRHGRSHARYVTTLSIILRYQRTQGVMQIPSGGV